MKRNKCVLVIGHSYVRRMKDYIDKGNDRDHNFSLVSDKISTNYISIPGGRVNGILNMIRKQIPYSKSTLAIVLAGGNDLDGGGQEPGYTADTLLEIARALQNRGYEYVILSQIIRRQAGSAFIEKMTECNLRLESLCSRENRISFWVHARINRANNIHEHDGTHLNDVGNALLYRSFKNAISHTLAHQARNHEPCRCKPLDGTEHGRRRGGRRHR